MEAELIIPDELRFAITRKCDGSCRHCYNQSGTDIDRLSAGDFIQIVKETRAMNAKFDRITITGGEPMKEKEKVLNISTFARSLGIRVRLVTRGWELSPNVCKELKEAGVTRIQIGLDSSGEIHYEDDFQSNWDTFHSWLRGDKMGFNKTISAIKIAIDTGIDVSVRYSLCRSNSKDVINTYRLISLLGASKFKFRVLFPDGRAKERLLPELISGDELALAQYELIKASQNQDTVIEITQPCNYALPGIPKLPFDMHSANAYKEACPCGTVAAYIDSNGDVKYCLFDEMILGNVIKESFLNIWNSVYAKTIRKQRCPLDKSGSDCSAFKMMYSNFKDYLEFRKDYVNQVKEIELH